MDQIEYLSKTVECLAIENAELRERLEESELDAAVRLCEEISVKHRDAYNGRTDPIDRSLLYNPHTDGMSDGAWECAEAIRALKGRL